MKAIKKIERAKSNVFRVIPAILIVLLIGFLLRVILSPFGTLTLDQNTFIAWGGRLVSVGFGNFYKAWSDYLPGYLYILYFLAQIQRINIFPTVLLYKLPAILSDIGTGYLIYLVVRKLKNERWGVIAAALYLFNPAIIANSAIWGQVDGLTAFFSLLALWALDVNPYLSGFALAFGTVIKPQAALVSLIVFFLMIQRKWDIKKISVYILFSFFIFVLCFVPFSNTSNLASFIVARMNATFGQYPYTSVNAFNFWGILGMWGNDAGYQLVGVIIILVLFFAVGLRFLKKEGGEYVLLAFLYATSFLFMTRMHERHMLPTFAPLTIAFVLDPIYIIPLLGFSFIYITNLYWAWAWVTNRFNDIFGEGVVKLLSLINVLFLSIFLLPEKIKIKLSHFENLFLPGPSAASHKFSENAPAFGTSPISSKKIKILFVGVVVFASIARFYNLASPSTHYFDEVYHAFTAQNMLHGITFAWEWWNPNPSGFAYEWTHPPLAKEGMVLGMKFLGENAFGWRFPGALLGVGSVILIFFIAKEIFDDELIGLLASAILSLDGLALVTSRIGMNDTYLLFFSLLSIYSFIKKRNFWSAVFFGLAVASKWSGVWVFPILVASHFVFRRKLKLSYIFFFILPPIIYISTYFPIFTNVQIQNEYVANTSYALKIDKVGIIPLDMFIDTQKQMWWYHTRLKATHPYSSNWYTWPFLIRPIYLYTSDEVGGFVSRIYMMGNPIVFWTGVGGVIIGIYFSFRERNKKLGLVVFSYLVFFTPWALSPRIMFLYHYLPSVPFMAILIAYALRRFKEFLPGFLIVALLAFIYFYPHFAGLKIPLTLDSSYYWFPSWR